MTDEALQPLQPPFNNLYAKIGRPSIAPEKLLRAFLLQALYSVRSERMLLEQLDYNLLFRWFVGLIFCTIDHAHRDAAPHNWILSTLCCTERKKRRLARPVSENG